MRVIPEPPFAAIAFSKSSNLNEVMNVAVDLRESFRSYRSLLTIYRRLHAELREPRPLYEIRSLNKEIHKIESSFSTALEQNVKLFAVDVGIRPRFIFDVLQGVRKLAIAYAPNSYESLIDQAAEKLIDVITGCSYMHYGGVYEIVSKYPDIFHLNGTVKKLINKELDKEAQTVLKDARDTLATNYLLARATGFVTSKVTEGGVQRYTIYAKEMIVNESNTFTGNTNPIIIQHSHVGDIHQNINAAPIDTEEKKELSTLVDQLRAALERVPGDRAEAVAKQLKQTMEEITQRAPNKISLGESNWRDDPDCQGSCGGSADCHQDWHLRCRDVRRAVTVVTG
jgi:hypothetical protein